MKRRDSGKILAENMRRLRKAQKMSQEVCAEKCGLHRTYIGAVERGERNITLASLDKIAVAFGMSALELLTKE